MKLKKAQRLLAEAGHRLFEDEHMLRVALSKIADAPDVPMKWRRRANAALRKTVCGKVRTHPPSGAAGGGKEGE